MELYTVRVLTVADARQMLDWRYDPPYDIYDVVPRGLASTHLDHEISFLVNPTNHYFAVDDEAGELVGFCCYGVDAQVPGYDYAQQDALDIGLGMHPQKIGQGRGRPFLAAILYHARQNYNPTTYRATVAAFNQRSQRMFLRAAFTPVATFTSHARSFVVLTRPVGWR